MRIEVHGVVQGVGFRPFVYTTAAELALSGFVGNDSSGVFIEVEGEPGAVAEFADRVEHRPPPLAVVESMTAVEIPLVGGTGFHIGSTNKTGGRTLASPDVALCADCARELRDPTNRRYRHPFVNCTNCGPRFTIIRELPYDRSATTMSVFPMCSDCASEYRDPGDRRFHAQPVACPQCGPELEFVASGEVHRWEDALRRAREMLTGGRIVAVKGIGGYHLACDAYDDTAVQLLRQRKRRGAKPFAVMVPDLATAESLVHLDERERFLLECPQRPILLAAKRGEILAPSVAPHNRNLGLMIAYTPLHQLLFGLPGDAPGPQVLVMTSGNLGGEPICYRNDDALDRLQHLADGFLQHNRAILVPCDDSVIRVVDGEDVPIRRSRGYAPMPVALPTPVQPTLAVGADLKNTCAVADGRYAWLSQHIGDMDDLATLQAFTDAEQHLEELTTVSPTLVVADAHPLYRSTGWAKRHQGDRPLVLVQHHHAHIAAVMGEHGLDGSGQVIGFAFDGTGYGPDGAVWGGEVMLADYKGFQRLWHLRYVPLAGGDISVERPYRMALSHLWAAGIEWTPDIPSVAACSPTEQRVLRHQLETGFGCAPTSSMGRLFDAVASLAGVRHVVDYEAEAAIEFEGLTANADAEPYAFELARDEIDAAPVIRAVVVDVRNGVPAALIGARFHAAVSALIVDLAERIRTDTGTNVAALSGGVFQNAVLLSAARRALTDHGFDVISHRKLPPNDGGIALGQILAANAM
ncbi:carbamoyltransferase HypF [Smaragdicoccus niigatensis]|uniref:carbamoyltransferase HypF n=1 Tax=Smaragdicoccus niigatensis TaxID=359359 RepID=UPI000377EA4C|nr:carbamoyltransferase HypF [Smaragdicoccus niigatensis]